MSNFSLQVLLDRLVKGSSLTLEVVDIAVYLKIKRQSQMTLPLYLMKLELSASSLSSPLSS